MRITAVVLALAASLLAAPGRADTASRELTRDDLEAWLEGFFPYALAREDIAGAAVAVVRDGVILAQRGYGYADAANRTRVDPARTLFRTGSVGKLFTWTAVMQQVEAGTLDLDRDINDYLDFRIPPRDGQPITLRNLLTHTPGFEEPIKRLVTDRPARLPTLEEYVKAWTPERIFAPGEIPAYSNYGVSLAGYVLERVTGQTYDDYIDRNLFQPLGMTRSTTRQPLPAGLRQSMSAGYQLGSGPAQPFELFGVAPAGGASTTVTDMARFMAAWLQLGRVGEVRILRADTARQALESRLPIVPPLNSMLLGFYEKNRNGRRIAGHGGDSQFFHSSLDLFVDEGVGVYVVVNSSGRDGGAGVLLSRFMDEFADRYYPAPAVEDTVPAQMAAEHARLLAGTYMSSRRQESNFFSALGFLSQVEVTIDGDGGLLVPALTDIHGEPMKWREVTPFVWHHVEGRERLAARVRDGRVELLGVDSVSPFLVLQPVPWWKSSAIFLPLLTGALAVIVGMLIAWPVPALLRRHYRQWPLHAGPGEWPYRWARAAGAVTIGLLAAWMAVLAQVSGNIFAYAPEADPWIALLKAGTLLVCAGATVAALWDLRNALVRRSWPSRVASLLLVSAFGVVLWLAVVLKLAGFGTDY